MIKYAVSGNGSVSEASPDDSGKRNGADVYRLSFRFGGEAQSGKCSAKFFFENNGAYSVLSPLHCKDRCLYPEWRREQSFRCSSTEGIPFIQFVDKRGNNVLAFALGDFRTPVKMRGGIDERSGNIMIEAEYDFRDIREDGSFSVPVYADTRRQPYYACISDFCGYRDSLGFVPAYVPPAARRRTYSTWYSFQRDVTADRVTEQCLLAKEYGMDTVILDDGWQTPVCDQHSEAYLNAGDWEPYGPKFPDMEGFVRRLHENGMKVVLWIATPYVGVGSRAYGELSGMILRKHNDSVVIPDPRYAAVRKWYVSFLTDRMKRWKNDGFKLDFVDQFRDCETNAEYNENMDIGSVSAAAEVLMREITDAVRKTDPEALIEFRQSYIGPCMQVCGNMFRVDDCAYGSQYNRANGIDLRLFADRSAVHSDMLMWDYGVTTEEAADQLTALLFIVPQVSVSFDRLPAEHRRMLRFWLGFIDSNRDVLQNGKLVPLYPEANYPAVYSVNDGKLIAGLYASESFSVPCGISDFAVVNAAGADGTVICCGGDLTGKQYMIMNCCGDVVETGEIKPSPGIYRIPYNGLIKTGGIS